MTIKRDPTHLLEALVVALALAVAGCGSPSTTPSPAPTIGPAPTAAPTLATSPAAITSPTASPTASPTPGTGLPNFSHVYLIVMENKEYGSIVGSSAAPYINSLIARYGSATNMYAVSHPSEPNYIALTSGGLQGTSTDGTYNLSVPNLFDQVGTSGRTWHVYAQGYPGQVLSGIAGCRGRRRPRRRR